MAIGSFPLFRGAWSLAIIPAIFAFVAFPARAVDQLIKNDGTVVNGTITGVSDGQVSLTQGGAKTVVYLTDIKSVNMAAPAAVEKAKGAAPADVIATLAPLVREYAGLPSDWVVYDAMGQLADAYDAESQPEKAAAIYAEINKLYPNSPYQKEAAVGQAKIAVKAGKIDDAMAAVKPLIDLANQNIAPSPDEGRLYAGAFLVYGQALEAQKQYPQALEAYLTVKTMFYQNPSLVALADTQAKALLAQHPGVGID